MADDFFLAALNKNDDYCCFKQSIASCLAVESYLMYFASFALGYLATIF